jgi:hypothetical protein
VSVAQITFNTVTIVEDINDDKNLFDNPQLPSRAKYKSNCPDITKEYLFSSRNCVARNACGHAIHWECFSSVGGTRQSRNQSAKNSGTRGTNIVSSLHGSENPVFHPGCRVIEHDIFWHDCERSDDARHWPFLRIKYLSALPILQYRGGSTSSERLQGSRISQK